jgi:hypothetical protein
MKMVGDGRAESHCFPPPLDVVTYHIARPLFWHWEHLAPHKNLLKMRRLEASKVLQSAMCIFQERHGTHGIGSDHETVSKIDVGLALFAFDKEVGNRISMFPETLK